MLTKKNLAIVAPRKVPVEHLTAQQSRREGSAVDWLVIHAEASRRVPAPVIRHFRLLLRRMGSARTLPDRDAYPLAQRLSARLNWLCCQYKLLNSTPGTKDYERASKMAVFWLTQGPKEREQREPKGKVIAKRRIKKEIPPAGAPE